MKCVVHLNGQMTTIFLVKKSIHFTSSSLSQIFYFFVDRSLSRHKQSFFIYYSNSTRWLSPEASTNSKCWKKKIWEAFLKRSLKRSCIFSVVAFMGHFLEGRFSNTNLYWEFKAEEIFYLGRHLGLSSWWRSAFD